MEYLISGTSPFHRKRISTRSSLTMREQKQGMTIRNDGDDVYIRYFCPTFQGQLFVSPFLGEIVYLARHLVSVLLHPEIRKSGPNKNPIN